MPLLRYRMLQIVPFEHEYDETGCLDTLKMDHEHL